jgi:hypothetical protein
MNKRLSSRASARDLVGRAGRKSAPLRDMGDIPLDALEEMLDALNEVATA